MLCGQALPHTGRTDPVADPPTPADLKREADHERLARAFLAAGEVIEPRKHRIE
jgi:hypothetical protein